MSNSGQSLRKLNILHTSSYLFNKYGFHNIGIDRITESARVSKSTFYFNFQSKEKLIEMCLIFQKDELKDKVFSIVHSCCELKVIDNLKKIFFLHVDLEGFYHLQFKAIFEIEKLYPTAYKVVSDYRNWLIKEIYKLLLMLKFTATVEDAYIFLFVIDGAMMQLLESNKTLEKEEWLDCFLAGFINSGDNLKEFDL